MRRARRLVTNSNYSRSEIARNTPIPAEAVAALVREHRRGRADHKAVLYCLLELAEWHGTFVEAREQIAA